MRLLVPLSLALTVFGFGCGRVGFGLLQGGNDASVLPIPDGGASLDSGLSRDDAGARDGGSAADARDSLDGGAVDSAASIDAPTELVFMDGFDRTDSTNLGSDWTGRNSVNTTSVVRSNQLVYTRGDIDFVQEMTWHTTPAGSLDQWACVQFVSSSYTDSVTVSLGFRGEPGRMYVALSPHFDTTLGAVRNEVRYESFDGMGFVEPVAPACATLIPGLRQGDWMCGAVRGSSPGPASVSFWRFISDPGMDPRVFPAPDCEWTVVDDLDGEHVGLGLWTSDAPPAGETIFDNFRGGSLPAP